MLTLSPFAALLRNKGFDLHSSKEKAALTKIKYTYTNAPVNIRKTSNKFILLIKVYLTQNEDKNHYQKHFFPRHAVCIRIFCIMRR